MGRQVEQGMLFYDFSLGDRVPADHLLRKVDELLDLAFVREVMAEHYSSAGRPSVDPVLMVRMLLVGYLYGVRSERRLCEEVDLNLAYRWYCRLGLEGRVPDHSTFTKNRHGRFHDSKLMRIVFEHVVERCLELGLAEVQHVAVDGAHMGASAARGRFVRTPEELPREGASRAVREYFTELDEAIPDLEGVRRYKPKSISTTDPAAAITSKDGRLRFAYAINAMVDTGSGIALDVEAAPARTADEPKAARIIVERMRGRHGVVPTIMAADSAYGSAAFFGWAEDQGILLHAPVKETRPAGKRRQPPKEDFRYDETSDTYVCPAGKTLRPQGSKRGSSGGRTAEGMRVYYPSRHGCRPCLLKETCAPTEIRMIHRSPREDARERAKSREGTPDFKRSKKLRMRVERLFADIKHNDGFRRVRLRGRRGADEQFILAATARNLKRMITLLGDVNRTGGMAA